MKKVIVWTLVCCLMLCGCQITITPATEASAPSTEAAPTASTGETAEPTEATVTATAAPTLPAEEKVTVYLLEKTVIFDSGYTEYTYDGSNSIDCYTTYTIENELMCKGLFEQKDENGMAGCFRLQWPDGQSEDRTLAYFGDGKLKEELYTGSNYTGNQYDYDQVGNLTQKREYYDGVLFSLTCYEYDGETLVSAYGEDKEGNRLFECRVENGRIVETKHYDYGTPQSCLYKYDENGNLIETSYLIEGEKIPGEQYTYRMVEVDWQQAHYLQLQQRYLIPIP